MAIRSFVLATAIASASVTAAAVPMTARAQSSYDQQRWDAAQARFERERALYEREREIYERARARDRRGYYDRGPGPGGYDRYRTDYDASRYYRDGPGYSERVLGPNDQVYRGSDGRYYCRRNDGTTGLIIGGAIGGIFGNVIDGGRNRAGGTLLGGALGALLGREVDRNSEPVRCR